MQKLKLFFLAFNISFIFLLSFNLAFAQSINCLPTNPKSQNGLMVLNLARHKTQVYLIKNISRRTVLLNHPHHNGGAQAGFASMLKPNRWSAIAVSDPQFALSCAIQNGSYQQKNCRKLITVCRLVKPTSKQKTLGNIWLQENQVWPVLIKNVKQRLK